VLSATSASATTASSAAKANANPGADRESQVRATVPAVPATPTASSPQATLKPTPNADALLSGLDAAWTQAHWSEVLSLLDQIEKVTPAALDFNDKRYAAHMAEGQDFLAAGNGLAAAEQFANAQVIDPSRREATAALVALTPTTTPPATANSGVSPIGEILPPREAALSAVFATTTPWHGPVEVGVVQASRTSVSLPVILDNARYVYAYSCSSGQCKGFTTDVWRSLPRPQQRAYLDHLLDALHVALPEASLAVRIEARGGHGIVLAAARMYGGQRTYQGL
jgi:hypothetical protein